MAQINQLLSNNLYVGLADKTRRASKTHFHMKGCVAEFSLKYRKTTS